ncbi:hypothetical protein EDD85DRAFT_963125 [Armillaria nabsnona]|nr:hypothetical protein EDD85DRAFT_963131 [Armillaria nabsnona]KAK0214609.1 hypothetical protein EDD85DRAFT_963125 [Armillaria nabsnona]
MSAIALSSPKANTENVVTLLVFVVWPPSSPLPTPPADLLPHASRREGHPTEYLNGATTVKISTEHRAQVPPE